MNPLKTITGTIITGVVLAVIFAATMGFSAPNPTQWTVWFHVVAGITWIGLLYYFNFVQVPAMAAALGDSDGPGPAAIGKYVAPRALLWFRWAALATWLSGAALLGKMGIMHQAFMFTGGLTSATSVIGVGAWLGTIMLFNVWVFIWPNQKKILGMVEATPEQIASAKAVAFTASRTNTVLSIPMLMSMTAFGHGMPM